MGGASLGTWAPRLQQCHQGLCTEGRAAFVGARIEPAAAAMRRRRLKWLKPVHLWRTQELARRAQENILNPQHDRPLKPDCHGQGELDLAGYWCIGLCFDLALFFPRFQKGGIRPIIRPR